jgi:hypothetical protein
VHQPIALRQPDSVANSHPTKVTGGPRIDADVANPPGGSKLVKVSVKKLAVDMDIKNSGLELEVRDTANKFLGDLVITKSGVTWCAGKTSRENGKKLSWAKFIETMNA